MFKEKVSGVSLNSERLWGNKDLLEAFLEKYTMAELTGVVKVPSSLLMNAEVGVSES